MATMPPSRTWLTFLLILIVNYALVRLFLPSPDAPVSVPYTVFKSEVEKANVEAIYSRGESVQGRFIKAVTWPPAGDDEATPSAAPRSSTDFETTLPFFLDPGLEALLIEKGVEIRVEPIQTGGSPLSTLLFGFGPAILLIAFYVWVFRRSAGQGGGFGGLMGIGKSKARRFDQERDTRVTFDDVAGIDEAENELIEIVDFLKAPLEKIMLGPERPILLSDEDRERIAYHEGGHAILGLVVPGADPVHRVTIVPRGQALGVTYQRPDSDRYNYPEAYLRARIVGMLGGRAAEEVVYGTRTTGAETDIEQATDLARNMVTRWGMSDELGLVQLEPRQNPYLGGGFSGSKPFSEGTARVIDAEVQRIIGESHQEAVRLLRAHRKELDALAGALLERDTLDEQEILEVTGLPPAPALQSSRIAAAVGS
jgi:ATP-dependent Zn protease